MFLIKHVRSLDLLDGTPESHQEHCQKPRKTLMALQECKISWCTKNKLDMKPSLPALGTEPPAFQIIHDKWLDFL